MKKRVGIITMHRVPNCGSALQAYATQRAVESLGYDSEIIDYVYPNRMHARGNAVFRFLYAAKSFVCDFVFGRRKLFKRFYASEMKLSREHYANAPSLRANAPQYDIYLTGSDQVWNPRYTHGDTIFFCDFAPERAARISYAASFAATSVAPEFAAGFARCLEKYSAISVREKEGVPLVKKLCGKNAELVCDPTLLLDAAAWGGGGHSRISQKRPYLLVYILKYAYNPYPKIYDFVEAVQAATGLHAVFLNGRPGAWVRRDSECVNSVGPNEFVRLFRDADFVVTTSFHGTAFSLNFEKPFYSVVESLDAPDSRMLSLLREVGAEDRAIPISAKDFHVAREMSYEKITPRLEALRERSLHFLKTALEKAAGTENSLCSNKNATR